MKHPVVNGMKVCQCCYVNKDVSEFYRYGKKYNLPRPWCKKCHSDYANSRRTEPNDESRLAARKRYKEKSKEINTEARRLKAFAYSLKRNYNLSIEDYAELIVKQGYSCAICGLNFKNGKDTHVDHDHVTGLVRGLLCSDCNLGLGRFKDNTESLNKAIKYLEKRS